ncbi:MAG TPA: sugar-binding protein [Blastocatellia bacterium]|nr:sugar-binding protein [Blastocatellia bacterium]
MKPSPLHKLACLLAPVLILSASCASPQPTKPVKTKKTVAFVANTTSDFWRIARKGCEKADAELTDVDVSYKAPSTGTAKEQDKIIRDAVEKSDVDAIALSPADPAAQKKLINEMAKRVLVITQDSDAPDTDRALYLGADNRAAGRQAGELVKKALPQGGKIMVFVGKKEAQNAQDRFEGLKEALQGSKVEVIDLLTDDNDHIKAKDNAVETLEKYPDIAGMVGLWSYNGPAILTAVRNAKKAGKVKIVCFDEEQATLDGIKDGAVFGTVVQQPFEYGYQAVQVMAKILKGDKSVIPESKKILIPTVVVQKNNLEDFRAKMNQMLEGAGSASPAPSAKPAAKS